MLVHIDHKALRRAITVASWFAGSGPWFSRARLAAHEDMTLTVAASNGGETVRLRLTAEVEEPGQVYVPVSWTADLVRLLPPGPVTLRANGAQELLLVGGREQSRLQVQDGYDEEGIPGEEIRGKVLGGFSLPAPDLLAALPRVLYATSKDAYPPVLAGVYVDTSVAGEVRLMATDRYRLALVTLPAGATGPSFVLPARPLKALVRLLGNEGEVRVTLYGDTLPSRALFRFPSDPLQEVTLGIQVIGDSYPDFSRAMAARENPATVIHLDPLTVIPVVKRALIFGEDDRPRMQMEVDAGEGGIHVLVKTSHGEYRDAVEADVEGESMRVGFNPRFLLDALTALKDEGFVRLILTSRTGPVFLLPATADTPLGVVMPLISPEDGEGGDAGVEADNAAADPA